MIAQMPVIKAHNFWVTCGDPERRRGCGEYVTRGLRSGGLKPMIDRVFTFDEMRDVHRYLEQNGQFGKIVVTV